MTKQTEVGTALDRATRGLYMEKDVFLAVKAAQRQPARSRQTARLIPIAAMIAIAIATVSLAAGLGVFSRMSQRENADPRLNQLDVIKSAPVQEIALDSGVKLIIERAFFTENRLFVAYSMSCETDKTRFIEIDALKPDYDLSSTYTISENSLNEYTDDDSVIDWIKYPQHAAVTRIMYAGEGITLSQGENAPIICGDEYIDANGICYGWKECTIFNKPEGDNLVLSLDVFTYDNILINDGGEYKFTNTLSTNESAEFTAVRDSAVQVIDAQFKSDTYSANGSIEITQFDVSGRLFIECPNDWITGDYDLDLKHDIITGWSLYSSDELVTAENVVGGYEVQSNNSVFFDLCFMVNGESDLSLVPIYSQTGAHIQEAIPLK